MKTITTNDLNTVFGGASKKADADVSAQIGSLKSALDGLQNDKKSSSSDSLFPLIMVMALSQKQQGPTTVVAGGAPAAPVVAGGPVVNIRTGIGRRWG